MLPAKLLFTFQEGLSSVELVVLSICTLFKGVKIEMYKILVVSGMSCRRKARSHTTGEEIDSGCLSKKCQGRYLIVGVTTD